ncbi:MAG: NAD-dependent epimerase/dehydratase family protein [Candidatus Omnitrophica bacterium]|nr:NAD-dependent epimerase/dehydratase family protein [Candidatus Omnitrophota bacterium]
MNILVTGGAGFIGSHLVDRLIALGHRVTVIDSLEKQVHLGKRPVYLNKEAQYIFGDIANHKNLKKGLKKIDVIFHEAAVVGIGQSMYQIKKYVRKNTCATSVLLDYLLSAKNQVKKIIVASSMSIYGEGLYLCPSCGRVFPSLRSNSQLKKSDWEVRCPVCRKVLKPLPCDETKPLSPTSIYAITKRDQEEMCLVFGRAYKIPVVALRYFNVYGERQSLSNPYTGVAAIFLSRIKNDQPPLIYEDGKQSRDFIHISDVIEANILVMNNSKADYDVFNVGAGKSMTILSIAGMLIKLCKKPGISSLLLNKFRTGDIRHCFADINKIRDRLGFKPKISFENGMKSLIDWSRDIEAKDFAYIADRQLKRKGLIV